MQSFIPQQQTNFVASSAVTDGYTSPSGVRGTNDVQVQVHRSEGQFTVMYSS